MNLDIRPHPKTVTPQRLKAAAAKAKAWEANRFRVLGDEVIDSTAKSSQQHLCFAKNPETARRIAEALNQQKR